MHLSTKKITKYIQKELKLLKKYQIFITLIEN